MNIIGDVQGRRCILFDDIVDSGGTLVNAAKALIDQGATEVSAYISHGVLSGPAVQRITDGPLKELVIQLHRTTPRSFELPENPSGFRGSAGRRGYPTDRERRIGVETVRLTFG